MGDSCRPIGHLGLFDGWRSGKPYSTYIYHLFRRPSYCPFLLQHHIVRHSEMASHNANTVEETHSLKPQAGHKTEAEGGQLTLCLISHILICVPGENHGECGGSSDELWKQYNERIEKQDNEMVERWKGEAESTIIFVCTVPHSSAYLPPKEHDQGWSFLSCRGSFHC